MLIISRRNSLLDYSSERQITQPMIWHFLYQTSQVRMKNSIERMSSTLMHSRRWISFIHCITFIWM